MHSIVSEFEEKLYRKEDLQKDEALALLAAPLEELCEAANRVRKHFCGDVFDLCAIINGKSGRCPEDCKFCAQSSHYRTSAGEHPLLEPDEIVRQAAGIADRGALRISIVTSGRALRDFEIDSLCESVRSIKKARPVNVCVSAGLLSAARYHRLKEAGASRIHNNLETSERFFPNICTTHAFADKKNAVRAAKEAGLDVCSGGIIGMGETMEDRVDLALSLRELSVRSVPVNVLNPIPGTPLEKQLQPNVTELRRVVAVFRFLLPKAAIRLAGGRGLLPDKGKSCFQSGANAAISGDMLTTSGITLETDLAMIRECGFLPGLL